MKCEVCGGKQYVSLITYSYPCPDCNPNPKLQQLGKEFRRVIEQVKKIKIEMKV